MGGFQTSTAERAAALRRWCALMAAAVLACAAAIAVPLAGAAEPKSCQPRRLTAIDLSGGDRFLIPVALEGHRTLMRLDTGSPFSVVDEWAAREFNLPRHHLNPGAKVVLGDHAADQLAAFDPLAVGGVDFGKGLFVIDPARSDKPALPTEDAIAGSIGMDVLGRVDFEFDLAHSKLAFYAWDHCPGGDVVYWSKQYSSAPIRIGKWGNLYFAVELEGKPVDASLATENGVTTLRTDAAKLLYGFDENSQGNVVRTDPLGRSHAFRTMKLTAQGLEVTNEDIELLPATKICSLVKFHVGEQPLRYDDCGQSPLALGLGILRKLHVYVATKEKMLYFTAAEATPSS